MIYVGDRRRSIRSAGGLALVVSFQRAFPKKRRIPILRVRPANQHDRRQGSLHRMKSVRPAHEHPDLVIHPLINPLPVHSDRFSRRLERLHTAYTSGGAPLIHHSRHLIAVRVPSEDLTQSLFEQIRASPSFPPWAISCSHTVFCWSFGSAGFFSAAQCVPFDLSGSPGFHCSWLHALSHGRWFLPAFGPSSRLGTGLIRLWPMGPCS